MPPKKKKGSGKKKKGKKSGNASANLIARGETLNELSKEFFIIQIRDLENRLARYQKKCDELTVKNGQFRAKYDQMATDMKSNESYLKREREKRDDEIADLNDRLIGLQQARDKEKEDFEYNLQKLQSEFQETKDKLTSENMILGGKLASLEEFKVQKEDLMAKFANMEEELKKQDEAHQEVIYNLERKAVVDKDRLKKEMVMRVNQVAAEFRKVSNKQMAETTKRTIRENVSINAQLAKMSDKTMELIQENDELKMKEKKQRQQIDMLEANEKELAKKNHSNQKIIRMLTEECKNQEARLAEYEMQEQEYQEIVAEADLLRQQVESTRDEIEKLAKENELFEEETLSLKTKSKAQAKEKRKKYRLLADAAEALKTALQPTTSEDVEESEYEITEKRDNMLEHMLVLLNSAASIGIGPSPGDLGDLPKRARSASQMPGSGKGIRKGSLPLSPIAKSGGTLPHYQLGDLGLIPRPKQEIPSHFEKMRQLSATTRLGGLKKVLTRSVGVQTVSAPKAMFFADQLMSKMPVGGKIVTDIPDKTHILSPIKPTSKTASKVY